MFVTGIEITFDVRNLLPVDLKPVLRDRGVGNTFFLPEVVSSGTFLPQDSVQLIDKETMRGNQNARMVEFKNCGLGDQLGQELLRDPRPEVHHRLPAPGDPPGEEGPVRYVFLYIYLTANQFPADQLGICFEAA